MQGHRVLLFWVNGSGLAIGPVAGGMPVSAFGWRLDFVVNVPFILLSLASAWEAFANPRT
jgi:hypothetical protein